MKGLLKTGCLPYAVGKLTFIHLINLGRKKDDDNNDEECYKLFQMSKLINKLIILQSRCANVEDIRTSREVLISI